MSFSDICKRPHCNKTAFACPIYVYICICIYMYIYMYIHIHVCILQWELPTSDQDGNTGIPAEHSGISLPVHSTTWKEHRSAPTAMTIRSSSSLFAVATAAARAGPAPLFSATYTRLLPTSQILGEDGSAGSSLPDSLASDSSCQLIPEEST